MTPCPNSTRTGCRCPEHHPGLLQFARDPGALAAALAPHAAGGTVTKLHVVTTGPRTIDQQARLDAMLRDARANCQACGGDARRCNAGNGPPHYGRLKGCQAWNSEGELAARRAQPPPRQPWEARPSSRTAA